MAGRNDIRAGRAFVELFLKNSLTKGLQNAQKQLRAFGQSATAIGKGMVTLGVTAAVPFAFAAKTFMDFDDAMRMVGAVSQSTDAELAMLTATAKKLGASTSFTAIQVANLMGELGKAGFTAAEVDKMTASVLNLSRATGTDATLASGIMAASLRQFSLGANDAGRVADALTVAANASFNSVESLGEALSYAGPVAADFNMSIEDTLAVLGALGNVGIQGSNAGTAVRRLLTLGGAEADKLKGIFGVDFKDAAGNARPLVDVLDEVNTATKGLGTAARAAKFNEAFGLLGITGASAISKNAVSVRDLQKKLQEAGGTADRTAKKMDSGLGGAFRIMMSAIEGVQIAIGNALSPTLTKFASIVENAATAVIEFVDKNQGVMVGVAAIVTGVVAGGAALIAFGMAAQGVAAALGIALFAFKAIVVTIGFVLSPIGLITAALVGGVIAWAKWTDSGKAAVAAVSGVFAKLGDTFGETWKGIVDAIAAGDLELAAKVAWAGLSLMWQKGTQDVMKLWEDVKWGFMTTWSEATTSAAKFFTTLWAGVQSGWAETVAFLKTQWNSFQSLMRKAEIAAELSQELGTIRHQYESGGIDDKEKERLLKQAGKRAQQQLAGEQVTSTAEQQAIDSALAEKHRKIDADESSTLQQLEADRVKAQAARDSAYESAIAEKQKALDDATKAFNEAKSKATAKGDTTRAADAIAEYKALEAKYVGPGRFGGESETEKKAAMIASGNTFGSFSADALSAQGNGGANAIPNKILQEAKRGNKEVAKKIDRQISAIEKLQMQMVG